MSRMLSMFSSPAREVSARDVAARATEAAIRAADAAIRAADAAIQAADAAVRLIDEHNGEIIVLQPAPPGKRAQPGVTLPLSAANPFSEATPPERKGKPRALALALIVIGALVLADAGVTLVWQEPLSALYAKLRQDHLSGTLSKVERAAPTPGESRALANLPDERTRISFLARELEHRAPDGGPVARIIIPTIGANFVVVKGTSTADLESGPGIYPETVFPGRAGTTAIAGHRTTFLAPFRHIDALRRGDLILLNTPYARFTYTVVGSSVVSPYDVRAAVSKVSYARVVLSACTPLFSAAKRLLVFARQTAFVPTGAGQSPGRPLSGTAEPLRGGVAGQALSEPTQKTALPPAAASAAAPRSGARTPRAARAGLARLAAIPRGSPRGPHRSN